MSEVKKSFDLNIEQILENWQVCHAVREVIANALDEQFLTGTKDVEIYKDGDVWHIRDYGRGLEYKHLTQNESPEKKNNGRLIGKFGVGLKDALATFFRNRIGVKVNSRYMTMTLAQSTKVGFSDIKTLQAEIYPAENSEMEGTDFMLTGCADIDIAKAMSQFLKFNDSTVLDRTPDGEVVARKPGEPAYIYINGVRVAEEENFLFSYNIIEINKRIKDALNRERSNVGRSAYASKVKDILLRCWSYTVVKSIMDDINNFSGGTQHDETKWSDVHMHAIKMMQKNDPSAAFVTSEKLEAVPSIIDDMRREGYKPIVIPTVIERKIDTENSNAPTERDKINTVDRYIEKQNNEFNPEVIAYDQLTEGEKSVYDLIPMIIKAIGAEKVRVSSIDIATKMSIDSSGVVRVGVWQPSCRKIYIQRSQLSSVVAFSATLIHEYAHAMSGEDDVSRGFENKLTEIIGKLAASLLEKDR